jgi:hypothetical protein
MTFHQASRVHPSSFAAPIGIHLRTLKNDKMPPICAFLPVCNKLPKLRTRPLGIAQSAESAIEFGSRLQRHQIAGLKN